MAKAKVERATGIAHRRGSSGVLLEGDCLTLLPELVTRTTDRFELVYVDPPFNTGVERRGRKAPSGPRAANYRDAWGGVDRFLSMLEPRLAAMRDVLSPTGSLWLHLDHRSVHEAKLLADRVFGRQAFRGEVIWVPGNGGRRRNQPSVTHQTILIYARGREMTYNSSDPCLREPYAETSLRMHFKEADEDGRRYRDRTIGGKTYRYYADEGRMLGSVWTDCPSMRANTPLIRESTGYPTQKPLALLERIVRAASNPGERVLDPMCGSGTTLVAALTHGRRFAGVDVSPHACELAASRLAEIDRRGKSQPEAPRPLSRSRAT
jgi:site-specific DNA-methyltransferase (adenine-specific)